jgi:hypothetical protein
VHEVQGTIFPTDIVLNGSRVNTGPITLSLDLTNPEAQTAIVDLAALMIEYHVDLLVMLPLLQTLGQPPQRIHIDEAGPIVNFVQTPNSTVFDAFLSGGGTFGPGQLLEGWRYENDKRHRVTATRRGETYTYKTQNGRKIDPQGNASPANGSGRGSSGENPVPEPSTFLLLGAGIVGITVFRRRRS